MDEHRTSAHAIPSLSHRGVRSRRRRPPGRRGWLNVASRGGIPRLATPLRTCQGPHRPPGNRRTYGRSITDAGAVDRSPASARQTGCPAGRVGDVRHTDAKACSGDAICEPPTRRLPTTTGVAAEPTRPTPAADSGACCARPAARCISVVDRGVFPGIGAEHGTAHAQAGGATPGRTVGASWSPRYRSRWRPRSCWASGLGRRVLSRRPRRRHRRCHRLEPYNGRRVDAGELHVACGDHAGRARWRGHAGAGERLRRFFPTTPADDECEARSPARQRCDPGAQRLPTNRTRRLDIHTISASSATAWPTRSSTGRIARASSTCTTSTRRGNL